MKKLFVSAGLVAIGATALENAMADDSAGSGMDSVTSPKYWSVGATLRGFYDDNYDIVAAGRGSFGLELVPTISFHEPFQQTDIGIRYTYGLYYYQDRNDLGINPFDQTHQVDLWVDHAFNERWHANFTDTFAVGQEPELLSPNPLQAQAAPYRIDGDNISNHGSVVLNTDWTRQFSTSLTYDNGFYDYENSGALLEGNGSGGLQVFTPGSGITPSEAGILNRVEQSIALDLKWLLQPETVLFAGYQFSWVDFTANEPIAVINNLFSTPFVYHSQDRDNYSHYLYVGIEQSFTPNLMGSIRAGASYTDAYADPLFPSTAWNPYADISLTYTYLPGSYLQFGFTHDVSTTDQVAPNAGGGITQYADDSVVYLDINHRITSKLMASVIGRVQYSTFVGGLAGADDETDYGIGVNLSYQINTHFSVDAGYNYDNVETQIAGYAYTRNRVYLGVTASY